MIVFTATLWPGGQQLEQRELLHGTVANVSSPDDPVDTYTAHVTARPNRFLGVEGFDTDLELFNHIRSDGITPLLRAVLDGAFAQPAYNFPRASVITRRTLRDEHEFEAIIRGRR